MCLVQGRWVEGLEVPVRMKMVKGPKTEGNLQWQKMSWLKNFRVHELGSLLLDLELVETLDIIKNNLFILNDKETEAYRLTSSRSCIQVTVVDQIWNVSHKQV